MTVEYTVIEKVPSAEAFCHLRVAAGMSPRPLEGARAGLRKRSPGERGDGPRLANPQSLARISCQEKSVVQMATRLTARSSLC